MSAPGAQDLSVHQLEFAHYKFEKMQQEQTLNEKIRKIQQSHGGAVPAMPPRKTAIAAKKKKGGGASGSFLSTLKKQVSKSEEAKKRADAMPKSLACDVAVKKALTDPNVRITSNRIV